MNTARIPGVDQNSFSQPLFTGADGRTYYDPDEGDVAWAYRTQTDLYLINTNGFTARINGRASFETTVRDSNDKLRRGVSTRIEVK